jgi:glycosyltransferase involved in cell wall biosynthesis
MRQLLEVSIVMPCLNEAETIGRCVDRARESIAQLDIRGEVLVADNGSTDGSQQIALAHGAKVVVVDEPGYGAAIRGGVAASSGRYIIMGDADESYDFGEIPPILERLRVGDDLVMGNRFAGGIDKGAMPWSHRWIGNPVLSMAGRIFFSSRVRDFHCGLRGFSVDAFRRMRLNTTGMEFASEIVVKASLASMKISEVPISLHKDGRSRPPHLRTWRDGWRHLRFLLLFCPRWLFVIPGLALLLSGSLMTLWLLGGTRYIGAVGLDIHTMLVSGVFALIGYELMLFGAFIKVFGMRAGFLPSSRRTDSFFRVATLEKGLLVGGVVTVTGLALVLVAVVSWGRGGYGVLNTEASMRPLIVAVLLIAGGVQTIFASFVLSMLGIRDNVAVSPSLVLEPSIAMQHVTGVAQRHPLNGSPNGSRRRPERTRRGDSGPTGSAGGAAA